MKIDKFKRNNQTLSIISMLIYNNHVSRIINSITNKIINRQHLIDCNVISHGYDFGFCIMKIWICKNHVALLSFDYNLIILLFIAIV